MNTRREKVTEEDSIGKGWQLHEALCPKHLVLRGKRESSLCYSTLEGHGINFFLSQTELLPGFPAEIPDASFSFLKQNWQSDHLKVKLFHSVQYFLAKAVSCCESCLGPDCEHSASRREFGLLYFFGVINSRGRKPLCIWQLILAMWSWWKCC